MFYNSILKAKLQAHKVYSFGLPASQPQLIKCTDLACLLVCKLPCLWPLGQVEKNFPAIAMSNGCLKLCKSA